MKDFFLTVNSRGLLLYLAASLFSMASIENSEAEVTRVVATSSGPMGVYGGRDYIWVMADMHGIVEHQDRPTTHYRVPIILMYPNRDGNGFGFVDVVNTAAFHAYHEGEAPGGKRSAYHNGYIIYSDYLRRNGFTYLSVQWSRLATYVLGADYGVIEDGRDGFEIVKDAARFLRSPLSIAGDVEFPVLASERVIGFGYSQTAFLFWTLVHAGLNREQDRSLVFDGIIAGGGPAGGECMALNNDESPRPAPKPPNPRFYQPVPCSGHLPEDGKYMNILSQTEVDFWSAHIDRKQSQTYRQYELAGVAHIPVDILDLRLHGATRQNPVSFKPFYKAALRNMLEWIVDDNPPPDSAYLGGEVDAENKLKYRFDADGNVTGGVRLPHMIQRLENGEPAGAPLGVYGGIEPDLPKGFDAFSGTFEPFAKEALARRYASKDVYIDRVTRAVKALLADRHILEEDHHIYIHKAERQKF